MDAGRAFQKDRYPGGDDQRVLHELTEHIKLEHLDLMCEALGCDISDLIIRIPNPTPKILSKPSNGKGKVHK